MTCLTKNILTVASAEVFCKKLLFIALRWYDLHKFYNFAIIQALIMLKYYDVRKNILKLFHTNLKEDNTSFSKDLLYKQEKRD